MLATPPLNVARRRRFRSGPSANENLAAAYARLRASKQELEEARTAHARDPGVLTAMEVRFWATTVARNEKLVEKLQTVAG